MACVDKTLEIAARLRRGSGGRGRCRLACQALFLIAMAVAVLVGSAAGGRAETHHKRNFVDASSDNFPPLNDLDEKGELRGFGRELADAVVAAIGGTVTHVHSSVWTEVLEWLDSGKADFIHDTGLTEERLAFLDYTAPILEMPENIFVQSDRFDISGFEDLKGKTVACVNQHITHLYLKRFPEIRCLVVKRPVDGVLAVLDGDADAFVYPRQIALHFLYSLRIGSAIKVVGEPLRTLTWHMTVKKGNRELVALLDQGIGKVRASGAYDRIYEKWFGESLFRGHPTNVVIWFVVGAILLTALGAGLIFAVVFAVRMRAARYHVAESAVHGQRLEQLLDDSEKRFGMIAEATPVAIIISRLSDGEIQYANSHAGRLLGAPRHKILGRKMAEFDELPDSRSPLIEKLKTEGVIRDVERRFRRVDGSLAIVLSSLRIVEFGGVKAVAGGFQDITKRKRTEAALKESERRYYGIVEDQTEFISRFTSDGTRKFTNGAFHRFLGSERDEQIEPSLFECVHEDDVARVKSYLSSFTLETPVQEIETRILRHDGEYRLIHWKDRALFDSDGEVREIQAVGRDITDRKQTENQLAEAKALLEQTFTSLDDAIIVVNPETRIIIACNAAMERIFGYTADEVIGRTTAILHESKAAYRRFGALIYPALEESGKLKLEYRMRRKDGSLFPAEGTVTKFLDESGNRIKAVGVFSDITERKQTEEALKESERRYYGIIEDQTELISRFTIDGTRTFINGALHRFLGYETGEQGRASMFERMHEDDVARVKAYFSSFTPETPVQEIENRVLRHDGEYRWIHWTSRAFFDTEGSVQEFQSAGRDVTERKQTEEALRESERRYHGIVEDQTEFISRFTFGGTRTFINGAYLRFLGGERDEKIGASVFDSMHEDDLARAKFYISSFVPETPVKEFENRALRHDGEYRWVHWTNRALFDSDGEVREIQTVGRDITDRKHAKTQLVEAKTLLEQTFTSLDDAIIVVDTQTRVIIACNAATERIFGYAANELIGKTIAILHESEAAHQRFIELLDPALDAFGKFKTEYKMRRKDGSVFLADRTVTEILDESGNRIKVVGVIEDITKRKQTEEALRESERRYYGIVEDQTEFISRFTIDGTRTFINGAYRRFLGGERGVRIGIEASLFDCIHEDDLARMKSYFSSFTRKTPVQEIENRVLRHDGEYRLIHWTTRALFDFDGDVRELQTVGRDITDRKQTENQLVEAKTLLEQTFTSLDDAIIVVDPETRIIITCNAAMERIFGYAADEVIGRTTAKLFESKAAYRRFGGLIYPALDASGKLKLEYRMRRKDGSFFPAECTISEFHDEPGNQFKAVGVFADITERKEMETVSERLIAAIDSLSESVAFYDADDRLVFANASCRRINRKIADISVPGASFETILRGLLDKGVIEDAVGREAAWLEERLEAHRNPSRHFETNLWNGTTQLIHEQRLPDGGTATIMLDITKNKRAENAVRENEALLKAILSNVINGVITMDGDGTILSFTRNAEVTFGYSAAETTGRNISMLMPESESGRHGDYLVEFPRVGEKRAMGGLREVMARRKDGAIFPLEIGISEVLQGDKRIFVATVQDRTEQHRVAAERHELEEHLRQAQKLETIGTLTNGIAHDFNNILTPIMGFVDMALHDLPEKTETHANLNQVMKAVRRAKELINQILTFGGSTEGDQRDLDVGLVIEEALQLLRPSLPSTIEIRDAISADLPRVMGDTTQLHQVVMNLCTNAYQAMREGGGVLDVKADQVVLEEGETPASLAAGSYVRLAVSDTGHGMDEATMQRIFEPFYTTKEVNEGTGLGLSVVHGIVSGHGGLITVDSAMGRGTTFTVYLPVADIDGESVAGPGATRQLVPGNGHVLFVDDEPDVTDMGRQILERLGYQVTVTEDSRAALKAFRAAPRRFDVVITDHTMPRMTGVELAARIRKVRPDVPIILVTGDYDVSNSTSRTSSLFRKILTKPILMSELSTAVHEVMKDTVPRSVVSISSGAIRKRGRAGNGRATIKTGAR